MEGSRSENNISLNCVLRAPPLGYRFHGRAVTRGKFGGAGFREAGSFLICS